MQWKNLIISPPNNQGDIGRQIEECRKGKGGRRPRALVVDAALLIEVGLEKDADEIWVVKMNQEEQVKRLAKRDNLTQEEALRRIAALLQEEKLRHATRIIDNSGDKDRTIRQVDCHWDNMLKNISGPEMEYN